MQSLPSVFGNSIEDTTDDFISTLLFSEMREITKPLLNNNGDLSLLDEAKNNFFNLFQNKIFLAREFDHKSQTVKIKVPPGFKTLRASSINSWRNCFDGI